MAKTDLSIGRHDRGRADEPTMVLSALTRARRLFADLSETLEKEIDHLQFRALALEAETNDPADGSQEAKAAKARLDIVMDLVRRNQDAMATVLRLEAKLMETDPRPTGGGAALDLDAARAEITRRLACLAA